MNKPITVFLLLFTVLIQSQDISPKRELRGTWLATVVNIDWPSSPFISSSQKIIELIDIFDKLDSAGINCIYFQVRTECDALYNSKYEPWSYWLTGEQNSAPNPYFDPLEFAISEAHNRGMELHAWLNPYRAVRKIDDYSNSYNHISRQHPEWILEFDDYKMLNPGIPEVKQHIVNVVDDIISKYDIDGIHFDDYFYPYTPHISYEDEETFKAYGVGFTNVDDWRRYNINSLMKEIYLVIKKNNKRIKFGISPFGIVENKYAGTKGFESYHKIYCDPLNWLQNNIVDYITPQVYWDTESKNANYYDLIKWWAEVTPPSHLYIGMFSSKFSDPGYSNYKSETIKQLQSNRKTQNIAGEVYFSAKSIFKNYGGLYDSLQSKYYKYPALVPQMTFLDSIPANPPVNIKYELYGDNYNITWNNPSTAVDGELPNYYVVYGFNENETPDTSDHQKILAVLRSRQENNFSIDKDSDISKIVISSLDRLSNESLNNSLIIIKHK